MAPVGETLSRRRGAAYAIRTSRLGPSIEPDTELWSVIASATQPEPPGPPRQLVRQRGPVQEGVGRVAVQLDVWQTAQITHPAWANTVASVAGRRRGCARARSRSPNSGGAAAGRSTSDPRPATTPVPARSAGRRPCGALHRDPLPHARGPRQVERPRRGMGGGMGGGRAPTAGGASASGQMPAAGCARAHEPTVALIPERG